MVYIVDDDQNVRDGFMMLLKSAGFEYSCFENAEKFLKNFKPGVKDFLILDMHLTGMDGCTLLEKMEMEGLHLPVIVISAFDAPKYRECCREYGVLAFLRKPVDGEALIDLIKYNLESQLSTNNI
jgi:FixJ family two-component response regulator